MTGKAKIEDIERLLRQTLAPSHLDIVDESHKHIGHAGAQQGGHYRVVIVSTAFESKSLLERHRMVYQTLEPLRPLIHALAITAKTPEAG